MSPQDNTVHPFFIEGQKLELCIPSASSSATNVHSPYWAKVWPAAIGLCAFLSGHPGYIQNKKVTELAAGLGLPSIFAARYAETVLCTDIEPAAVELVKCSVQHNGLLNVHCAVAAWNATADTATPGVLLLSDVNYEPAVFDELYSVIHYYLKRQCTVIISTPQRLMAKPFIEQLLPYCSRQEELLVNDKGIETAVSVFVLNSL